MAAYIKSQFYFFFFFLVYTFGFSDDIYENRMKMWIFKTYLDFSLLEPHDKPARYEKREIVLILVTIANVATCCDLFFHCFCVYQSTYIEIVY